MSSCLWPIESYDFTVFDFKSITWMGVIRVRGSKEWTPILRIYAVTQNVTGITWEQIINVLLCECVNRWSDSQPLPSGRPGAEEPGWGHRGKGQQPWSSASPQRVPPPGLLLHHTAWGRKRCWTSRPLTLLPRQSSAPWPGRGRSSSPVVVGAEKGNAK